MYCHDEKAIRSLKVMNREQGAAGHRRPGGKDMKNYNGGTVLIVVAPEAREQISAMVADAGYEPVIADSIRVGCNREALIVDPSMEGAWMYIKAAVSCPTYILGGTEFPILGFYPGGDYEFEIIPGVYNLPENGHKLFLEVEEWHKTHC